MLTHSSHIILLHELQFIFWDTVIHLLQIFLLQIKQVREQNALQLYFLQLRHCFIQERHVNLLHVEQFIKQLLQYFLLHSVHKLRQVIQ